jgi:hypothetical protein
MRRPGTGWDGLRRPETLCDGGYFFCGSRLEGPGRVRLFHRRFADARYQDRAVLHHSIAGLVHLVTETEGPVLLHAVDALVRQELRCSSVDGVIVNR